MLSNNIIVAGSGTDVGKTIVSAILMEIFEADYWKPVQTGDDNFSDSNTIKKLIDTKKHHIFKSAYSFDAPLSPHHAAKIEHATINITTITPPTLKKPLIIESVGGILVPLTDHILTIDLFKEWEAKWFLVSKHYLGSINHTLLTLECLKTRGIKVSGIIFNGDENKETEQVILNISKVPFLGRLLPEKEINNQVIQRYAKTWKPNFLNLNH